MKTRLMNHMKKEFTVLKLDFKLILRWTWTIYVLSFDILEKS